MTQLRICITTNYDKSYQVIGDICRISIQQYAQKYGYEYRFLDNVYSDRPMSWSKVLVIQALFQEGYDFVFWIDADAMFVQLDQDISDQIDDQHDIYLVSHDGEGGQTPNCGVWLIRNTRETRHMLKELWAREDCINALWWEQTAFIEYLGLASELPKRFHRFFSRKALAATPQQDRLNKVKWLDPKWNYMTSRIAPKSTVIRHYGGLGMHHRIAAMIYNMRLIDKSYYLKKPGKLFYGIYCFLISTNTRLFIRIKIIMGLKRNKNS
ncbi:MAG: hypothetical protein H6757_04130 [Candidatus Omnitrophica bacterium]|nr:hypothetical protein [Candidatus Omnitrophota bacterium]